MKRQSFKKLMAYIYMPLIFGILGYGIVYLAVRPILDVGVSVGSLFLSSTGANAGNMEGKSFEAPAVTEVSEQLTTLPLSDIHWPEYGDIYGQLSCERIGLSGDVYFGDDNEILRAGVGQFMGSSIPGDGHHILLGGHNTTIFAPLQNIVPGDVVTFTTTYGIYQYQITEAKILNSDDPGAYDLLAEGERLVMYTCYPFTALGSTSQRYFVYGDKIAGPELVQGGGQ